MIKPMLAILIGRSKLKPATMSTLALTVAFLALAAPAQQSVPDAPQPQKKQTAPAPAAKPKEDNPFPEDVSRKAATPPPPDTANPFPEEQSKAAAKAAGDDVKEVAPIHDPARSIKDDEVGSFYLKKGDYPGALLRYQDAAAADSTNVSAIFGLAEAQHRLKKNADAIRNYELYLDIVPDGPKAKQALKALTEIKTGK